MIAALVDLGRRAGLPAEHRHRRAARGDRRWIDRRFGVDVPLGADRRVRRHQGARRHDCRSGCSCARPTATPCCIPAVAYPTYEMGAILAGCRAGAGAGRRADGGLDLDADRPGRRRARAVLWVNSPATRPGALDDLGAAAAWGRAHGVPVFSDECYVEFTWDGPAQHDPRARPRRRGRRALAVEALEPGRRAGRLLRRRRRPRRLPAARSASTSG